MSNTGYEDNCRKIVKSMLRELDDICNEADYKLTDRVVFAVNVCANLAANLVLNIGKLADEMGFEEGFEVMATKLLEQIHDQSTYNVREGAKKMKTQTSSLH